MKLGHSELTAGESTYMRRALRLAERGRGYVSPNPVVGAVLVRDGVVVGEGAHLKVGGPHAEVHALTAAGDRARGSTLYVTLEPCAHHGRTPPCTQALIEAGVRHVVCALEDPDESVRGRGFELLRAAGVGVKIGLLQAEAQRQNTAYLKHRRTGRPHVRLKLGQTLDGVIATRTGESQWITSERSRRHAHRMRAQIDAIVVGAGTVVADDPRLDVRHVRGPSPRPFVVDGRARTQPDACVFRERGGVLIAAQSTPTEHLERFRLADIEIWTFPDVDGVIDLQSVMAEAGRRGVTAMLIEGGRTLAAAALRDRVVDEVIVYVAPCLIGDGVHAVGDLGVDELSQAIRLDQVRTRRLGSDLLYTAEVRYSCSRES